MQFLTYSSGILSKERDQKRPELILSTPESRVNADWNIGALILWVEAASDVMSPKKSKQSKHVMTSQYRLSSETRGSSVSHYRNWQNTRGNVLKDFWTRFLWDLWYQKYFLNGQFRLNTPMIRHGTWGGTVDCSNISHEPCSSDTSKTAFLFHCILVTNYCTNGALRQQSFHLLHTKIIMKFRRRTTLNMNHTGGLLVMMHRKTQEQKYRTWQHRIA